MHWINKVLLQLCLFCVRRHNDIGLVTAGKETAGTGVQEAWSCLSAVRLPLKLERGKAFEVTLCPWHPYFSVTVWGKSRDFFSCLI